MPPGLPVSEGASMKKMLVGEGATEEQAAAIQAHLTSDRFVYSESAPVERGYDGSGLEMTEQFLEARRWCNEGYLRFPGNPTFTQCSLFLMLTPDATRDVPEAWRLLARLDSVNANRPEQAALGVHLQRLVPVARAHRRGPAHRAAEV